MDIYLPIADIVVFAPALLGGAFFVGIISGLLGISGGFILTPLMIFLGIPSMIAIGSINSQVFASSFYAVFHYQKKKMIPLRASLIFVIGGIIGVIGGVKILGFLSTQYDLELITRWAFIGLLSAISLLMLMPPPADHKHSNPNNASSKQQIELLILGIVIGIIAGVMGIGGGVLVVPALIYIMCMNRQNAQVLSQINSVFMSLIAFIIHLFFNHNIDPVLCVILVLGGFMGAYVGVKFSEKISFKASRYIFALVVGSTVCMIVYDLIQSY